MNMKTMVFVLFAIAAASFVGGTYLGGHIERAQTGNSDLKLKVAIKDLQSGSSKAALDLLTPLAASGNAQAQYWLGDMYENGLGTDKNLTRAMELYGTAAENGVLPAQARLGSIYFHGDDVVQDVAKARKWLTPAALSGDGLSAMYLGQIYRDGVGVTRDKIEAYAWLEVAALSKIGYAQVLRDQLVSNMAADEITAAEDRARTLAKEMKTNKASQQQPLAKPSGAIAPK